MNIGVDIGGMSVKAGIVDDYGKIIYKKAIPTGASRKSYEIVKDIINLITELISSPHAKNNTISSIGIGIPGAFDQSEGKIIECGNINLKNIPLTYEIKKYTDIPVYLNNDANCAALAEYIYCNDKPDCFIAVTLGTGIGGGIILDGRILSGINGFAGEIGHMVISESGNHCNCGRDGCWETYASVTALINQTKEAILANPQSLMNTLINGELKNTNGKTAFDAAKQGDAIAISVVEKYIHYISVGIVNLINIFRPNVIAIGGAISKEGDFLLNPIINYCNKKVYASSTSENKTKLTTTKLGNDAGIIGASLLYRSIGE